MATYRHPVTGVELNGIIRRKRLTKAEQLTARLLMAEGECRWSAALRLGTHPLQIGEAPAQNRKPGKTGKPRGGTLSRSAATRDPRQFTLPQIPLTGR